MRRALILPTVTILLLLGLCIANGLLLRQHTDRWSGMAAETARYARSERWPEARRELDALAADWDEAQIYLHIVVHHSTLGEVQTLLTRCRTLCDTGDSQALLPELAELECQLDALDEQIQKWQDKMSDQIDRYTAKFSALEQLVSEMNSQSSYFAGLMSGY